MSLQAEKYRPNESQCIFGNKEVINSPSSNLNLYTFIMESPCFPCRTSLRGGGPSCHTSPIHKHLHVIVLAINPFSLVKT